MNSWCCLSRFTCVGVLMNLSLRVVGCILGCILGFFLGSNSHINALLAKLTAPRTKWFLPTAFSFFFWYEGLLLHFVVNPQTIKILYLDNLSMLWLFFWEHAVLIEMISNWPKTLSGKLVIYPKWGPERCLVDKRWVKISLWYEEKTSGYLAWEERQHDLRVDRRSMRVHGRQVGWVQRGPRPV